MKARLLFLAVCPAVLFCANLYGQGGRRAAPPPKKAEQCGVPRPVAADLAEQVDKFKLVSMPFSVTGLSPEEQKLVYKLVDAARYLDGIYWRQSDPRGLDLLKHLSGCNQVLAQKVRRFLLINGSRYNLLEDNIPFIGSDPFSPGRSLYPPGITRQEIEAYVEKHPETKAQIYSPYTVIKRQGANLLAVPYHVEYRQWLAPAAAALREAAALSTDQ